MQCLDFYMLCAVNSTNWDYVISTQAEAEANNNITTVCCLQTGGVSVINLL